MTLSAIRFYFGLLGLCVILVSHTVVAAPGNLADSPLFTTNSTPPNVFFEVDDSGSMDWEIMSVKHWRNCAYDKDSFRATGDADCGDLRTNGRILLMPDVDDAENFEYLYDNDDDAYDNNCSSSRETYYLCSADVQNSDWRVRVSAVNVLYYNPDTTYLPWQKGDGTAMDNASFIAARSDPESNSAGYSEQDSLNGFIYEVWEDTHGFSGSRPHRGVDDNGNPTDGIDDAINRTDGANGLVDLWDKHTRYTVTTAPEQIVVDVITYSINPGTGALNPTTTTTTLSGTDTLNGRTIVEVQQNIANWYQYYRRRAFVTKAAISKVITDNPDYRYGLNFINDTSFPYDGGNTDFVEVPAGNSTIVGNAALISGLHRLNWPAEGTPLRTGLDRAGRYFDNEDGRTNPIIEQCQQNFTVLFTDGYWNSGESVTAIGDADDDGIGEDTGDKTDVTVADIAKFYYDKDLSPLTNNVVGNIFDPATYQHMVTFGVAFGVTGLLTDLDGDGWPGTAPGLAEDGDWGNPFNSDPEKIDDLWHASFNSKGVFVSATTPGDLSQSMNDALSNITDRIGSAASVAFNTTTLTASSSVFLAQFNSSNNKWSGDILSFPLDPVSGDVSVTPSWT
ncbi:MAG: pilus assembly protein, partial [Gammaproteobacteria bacterium]|nr:pilus assembly protein [Gammaproteobacteria bacterium]